MKNSLQVGSLHWDNDKGYGFDSTPPMSYSGIGYFAKYQELDNSPMGQALTEARVSMVLGYYLGDSIIDIVVGSLNTVNPASVTR